MHRPFIGPAAPASSVALGGRALATDVGVILRSGADNQIGQRKSGPGEPLGGCGTHRGPISYVALKVKNNNMGTHNHPSVAQRPSCLGEEVICLREEVLADGLTSSWRAPGASNGRALVLLKQVRRPSTAGRARSDAVAPRC